MLIVLLPPLLLGFRPDTYLEHRQAVLFLSELLRSLMMVPITRQWWGFTLPGSVLANPTSISTASIVWHLLTPALFPLQFWMQLALSLLEAAPLVVALQVFHQLGASYHPERATVAVVLANVALSWLLDSRVQQLYTQSRRPALQGSVGGLQRAPDKLKLA